MAKNKEIIKILIPPIISILYRKIGSNQSLKWSGRYAKWEDALMQCTGYENDSILEKCKISLLKVKNGEKAYERDSVVFDEIDYCWELLAGLQHVALVNENKLNVLDFGGSLGSTYFQNKRFLNTIKNINWNIVEQKHFVECGKEFFSDNILKFYYTVEDCLAENAPNVILLCSVLQYLENPHLWLSKLTNLNVPTIIIDRTGFIQKENDRITIQNVPQSIYKASYPCWYFNESQFIDFFNERGYDKVANWQSPFETNIGKLKGFIFIKKNNINNI